MKFIVTGDKVWVHYSEHKTKAQSKQWKQSGSPSLKTFNMSPSPGKVMLAPFWDSRGIIVAHCMPNGQSVTARYHSEVIKKK